MRRGEVRWYAFEPPDKVRAGTDKRRPVLILTRNSALSFLSGVTIAPITSTVRDIPTEVFLTPEEDGVPSLCAANLDNVQTVPKSKLGVLIATLSADRMAEVERALAFALGMAR